MSGRGLSRKTKIDHQITLERAMITRHYLLSWDLEQCVGCRLGQLVCPKEAISLTEAKLENGRLVKKPSLDVDQSKCVFCGMCELICPTHAITLTINDQAENPVLIYGVFPQLQQSVSIDHEAFDLARKELVKGNCPSQVIGYDEEHGKMIVEEKGCIHCRQCEMASEGAFQVEQAWEGKIELDRSKCPSDCLACADICPTSALQCSEDGELVLADYYCIKCGACLNVCPTKEPLHLERWRVRHNEIKSAAWITALTKMADDKAGAVEIDRKRALKRKDLFKALTGYNAYSST